MLFTRSVGTEALHEALAAPAPRLIAVRGDRGSEARAIVAQAVRQWQDPDGRDAVAAAWFDAIPQLSSGQLRAFCVALQQIDDTIGDASSCSDWNAALTGLHHHVDATRKPVLLVLAGPDSLLGGDGTFASALGDFWRQVRARALPVYLVLVLDRATRLPVGADGRELEHTAIDLDAPTAVSVRDSLSAWSWRDRLQLLALLGSQPGRLRHIDHSAGLRRNIQRLVVDPDGPLHEGPLHDLHASLTKPERYLAVLAALASGAQEWGEVRGQVPELAPGSTLAPYMNTLEEKGWVVASRSLDARPETRKRRYRLRDPFVGFWLRAVAPNLGLIRLNGPAQAWKNQISSAADGWVQAALPSVIQARLHDEVAPVLQVAARESGGLWGEGYDLPVAGTLTSGNAFYGMIVWGREARLSDLEQLELQLRNTRYGFTRETRVRVLFLDRPAPQALVRRAARSDDVELVELSLLF
jgi:hypothetical protein